MAHDVFISYASKDKPTADAVCAKLEARGIRCWIAPRDIMYGADWGEAIVDAISESRVMVLVFSSNANQSPHIKREVDRAVTKGVTIMPIRIEDVVPARALEYYISPVHWLDALTPPLEIHLKSLADKVEVLLARIAGGPALPRGPADQRREQGTPAPPPPERWRLRPMALAGSLLAAAAVGVALWVQPWSLGGRGSSLPVLGVKDVKPDIEVPIQPPDLKQVPHVKREVKTNITVVDRPPDRREIERLVLRKLAENGLTLRVEVSPDGIVTLTGVVRNQEQKALALAVARVPGVNSVKPNINVQERWQLQ
jgi:hypothetical protein